MWITGSEDGEARCDFATGKLLRVTRCDRELSETVRKWNASWIAVEHNADPILHHHESRSRTIPMQITSKFNRENCSEKCNKNEFYDPAKWNLKTPEKSAIAKLHFWFHMMPVLILEELFLVTKVCAVLNGKKVSQATRRRFYCCSPRALQLHSTGTKICVTNWSSGKIFARENCEMCFEGKK